MVTQLRNTKARSKPRHLESNNAAVYRKFNRSPIHKANFQAATFKKSETGEINILILTGLKYYQLDVINIKIISEILCII